MKGPRPAAIALAIRIIEKHQTLDEALSQEKAFDMLEGSDRGMARAMISATLRWLGLIDDALSGYVTGRRFHELDPDVKNVLRIGAAQICILKTPSHAAVSETVEAAKAFAGARRAGGLINAVLRKLSENEIDAMDVPPDMVWPAPFALLIREELGETLSAELADAALSPPPLDITCKSDADGWAEKLAGERIGPVSVRVNTGAVESLPGFEDGRWWVQDVAATLPVTLLAPQAGEDVLDLCAAPGGKTMQIAATGAKVTAVDRSAKRLRLVRQNLERTGLDAECITADATKWTPDQPFDAVLVDAPCSALGTLRRHPEGPWIKSLKDLMRFPDIQARLIEVASEMVKPGGRMVYCVCTPLAREGSDIVDAFLQTYPGWTRKPVLAEDVTGFERAITEKGDLWTLPGTFDGDGGCDAFYVARLERNLH